MYTLVLFCYLIRYFSKPEILMLHFSLQLQVRNDFKVLIYNSVSILSFKLFNLLVHFFFFFKIYLLMCLFAQLLIYLFERQSCRDNFPPIGSLPRCLKCQGLSQGETRNQERLFYLISECRGRDLITQPLSTALPRPLAGN